MKADFREVVVIEHRRPTARPELLQAVRGAHTLLCVVSDRIDAELLDLAPTLKHVITYSVGVDHIDLREVRKRQLRLSFAPDVLSVSTAELTWALILACARKVKPGIECVQKGEFIGIGPTLFLGKELKHKTLGLVGPGRIGSCVAQMAQGFQMKVIYWEHRPGMTPPCAGAQGVSWERLLAESDVLSLHCPLRPETKHLIGEKALGLMRADAVLVNTARGPIIDEQALIRHLQATPEFSAGLDVFEREPEVPSLLRALPNVTSLPHIGSATFDARQKMATMCFEEASRFAKGLPLRYEYPLKEG